jgi:hypothetical protein
LTRTPKSDWEVRLQGSHEGLARDIDTQPMPEADKERPREAEEELVREAETEDRGTAGNARRN